MAGQNYYLLSALPSLDALGDPPPMTPAAFLEEVADCGAPSAAQLSLLFLGNDLVQREAMLAGEIEAADLTVLSLQAAKGEAPLPAFLVPGDAEESQRKAPADDLWDAYYRKAASDAPAGSFMARWIAHEVGLRNACAVERAKALELDPNDYCVAADLADGGMDYSKAVNEWSAAATPLAGLKALDAARWAWITEHDAWFTFKNDELVVYGARLMLLSRWEKLTRAEQSEPQNS